MWPFQKASPQQVLEARLRRQWEQAVRETNLQLLPLLLVLRLLPRSTEEIEAERNAPMDWRQGPHKLLKQIGKKTLSASARNATKSASWLCRRPCLLPVRVALVSLARRAGLKAGTLLLRAYRKRLECPGNPK